MTGWRQLSVSFCPIMRARMSVDPPGANGTMILIGFSGYLSAGDCAAAPLAARTAAATAAARAVWHVSAMRCPLTFPSQCRLDVASSSSDLLSLGLQAGCRGFQCRRACLSAQVISRPHAGARDKPASPPWRPSPPRNLGSEALPHSVTGAAPARDGQGRSSAAFSRHLSRNDLLYFLFSSQSAGRLRVGVIALGGEDHAPIQRW